MQSQLLDKYAEASSHYLHEVLEVSCQHEVAVDMRSISHEGVVNRLAFTSLRLQLAKMGETTTCADSRMTCEMKSQRSFLLHSQ